MEAADPAAAAPEDPESAVRAATFSSVPSQFKNLLDEHNRYRAMHGVEALSWSPTLASQAAAYAKKCTDAPDPNIPRGIGETTFASSSKFYYNIAPLQDPTSTANWATWSW